jgi:hypothetical protein
VLRLQRQVDQLRSMLDDRLAEETGPGFSPSVYYGPPAAPQAPVVQLVRR